MTGAFTLTIREGEKKGRAYPLLKTPFAIGRTPGNDMVLEDKRVSRHHAVIAWEDGKYVVKDLGSQNGTLVNGLKVDSTILKKGDTIFIGGNTILFDSVTEDIFPGENAADMNTTVRSAKDILKYTLEDRIDESSIDILKQRTSMLGALYDLSRNILQELEIEAILSLTADIILKNLRAERVYILMRDSETSLLSPAVILDCSQNAALQPLAGKEPKGECKLMFSRTLIDRVLDEAVSLLVADAKMDSRFKESQSMLMYGIRSAMCVPLLGAESVIGTIYVDILNATRQFSRDELNLLTTIGNLAAIVIEQARLREKVRAEVEARQSLMRYHSPQVVEEIIRGKGTCEVNERMISVLFADIKDFTPLSEQLGPMETAGLLSEYFDTITDVVFKYRGTIDKFIGDAAMAIFGAPVHDTHHIEMAVRAALDIQKEIRKLGRYQVRIGINAGPAVIGNIGSSKRIEYTAIGDTVNIAARLEKMAGPGEIFISGTMHENIRDMFRTREIGLRKVKGKVTEILVHEVMGE